MVTVEVVKRPLLAAIEPTDGPGQEGEPVVFANL
jgi:hypothetical protein